MNTEIQTTRYIDLTGKRFGRWTVLAKTQMPEAGVSRWRCQCDCGIIKELVRYNNLVNGQSQSCGCLRSELQMKDDNAVHSNRNPLYLIWQSIKTRCFNKNHPSYPSYGGRGITMCERWKSSFDDFRVDVGDRPGNATLDRKGNNGNYEPGNVRWASKCEQAGNTRRNIKVSWKGWICNLIDVAQTEDVFYPTLRSNYLRNGNINEAVARCKEIGTKFKERAGEKLGIPSKARKYKPDSKLERRRYYHLKAEQDRQQLKEALLEKEKMEARQKAAILAEKNRVDTSKDGFYWECMRNCEKSGIKYRGKPPTDYDGSMDHLVIPQKSPP